MGKLSKVAVNPELEVNGVWTPWFDDARVKIARHNNPRFIQKIQDLILEHRATNGDTKPNSDQITQMTKIAAAHALLVDWENVEDDDGNPIVYTPELGLALFSDPEHHDFYRLVVETSQSIELYRKNKISRTVGN